MDFDTQIGKEVVGTGVGPYVPHEDFIEVKAYYQWVPFVLFLQAIMFYTPHVVFKWAEQGKVKVRIFLTFQLGSIRCKHVIFFKYNSFPHYIF